MRHSLPLATQFYVTAPQPCPYLDGRVERKLFTSLQGDHANLLNDALSQQGFRRSQNVLYRPACADCSACMSARIRVDSFKSNRSQRKTLRRNQSLICEASTPWATEEQYELFRRYLEARHSDGGMADMDVFEFAAMIEETTVRSRIVEYFLPSETDKGERDLVAACLTDVLQDGLSLVYSFFDPDMSKRSLGSYLILDHIRIAKEAGLPYVYLGYWVPNSPKMHYKSGFSGLEIFYRGAWQAVTDPNKVEPDHHPMGTDPIPEQVAAISLPDILTPSQG
jgi:arginine-tRNA-protein transferase